MVSQTGKNLVFLISLPRSGSTLLQKILANHSNIHSVGEPWLLLPLLYGNNSTPISVPPNVPYNSEWAQNAVNKSWKHVSDRNRLAANIYCSYVNNILSKEPEKELFLDKTPRYYFILDQIREVFPDAKLILLYRDPLDVLYSILRTWVKRIYPLLSNFKHDLYDGLDVLINKKKNRDESIFYLSYEELVSNSEKKIEDLCNYLDLESNEKMLDYNNIQNIKYEIGDENNLRKNSISDSSVCKWYRDQSLSYQDLQLLFDYLKSVGEMKYELLGYAFKSKMDLMKKKEKGYLLKAHIPLNFWLSTKNKPIGKFLKYFRGRA